MNQILVHVFLFLHLLGFASLLGGLLVQVRDEEPRVNSAMLHGSLTQLVTGIVLVALTFADVDHIKVTVKLAVLIVILAVILVRRRKTLAPAHLYMLLGLTVINVGIAVFW